jgi:hypothetical protein
MSFKLNKVMKKETLIKKLTAQHNTLLETVQKIKELTYTLDDPYLCECIDEWCDGLEEILEDGDGCVSGLIESIEESFSESEDQK